MNKLIQKYKNTPVQVKASIWFLVCTVIHKSISIVSTPIFTRLLSSEDYGKYGGFVSWMGILTCFVTFYIYSGIYPQAIVKFDNEKDQYSSAMQGLTFTLVIAWIGIYLPFNQFWNSLFSLDTKQMLAMFVIMWANSVFGFWSAEQRVEYKYRNLVIVTLLEAILQPGLCVLLIYVCPNDLTGVVWGIAIATFVSYFFLFMRQLYRGRVFYSGKIWRYSLKLAIPLVPHYLSMVLLNSSDRIMIQKIVGDSEAGLYNLAYTVSVCGTLVNQAVLQTLQPWILQRIKAKEIHKIKKVAYVALIGIAFFNLFIILLAPEVVNIFGPGSYKKALWAMPPIILSVYFMFMYNLFAIFEFYFEKSTYLSSATMVGAGLNVGLNYVFISQFGYLAAGYTTLICYSVFAIMHYIFMRRICKKELENIKVYDIKVLTLISIVFLLFGFSFMITYNYILVRYSLAAGILILCFLRRRAIITWFKTLRRRT